MKMNKILIPAALMLSLGAIAPTAQAQEERSMRPFQKSPQWVQLKKGAVAVYDFGKIKMHLYDTRDPFNSQIILLEKNKKMVEIETPPMKSNYAELQNYIRSLGYTTADLVVSYHLIGAGYPKLGKVKFNNIYSMQRSVDYLAKQPGKGSLVGLKKNFGADFDETVIQPTTVWKREGVHKVGGIKLVTSNDAVGFDVAIPAIKVMHPHILGRNNHTMLFSKEFLDNEIAHTKRLRDGDYEMYISSHSFPETAGDLTLKLQYLRTAKRVLAESKTPEEYLQKMDRAYPKFGWKNYLMGSSRLLFGKPMMPRPKK